MTVFHSRQIDAKIWFQWENKERSVLQHDFFLLKRNHIHKTCSSHHFCEEKSHKKKLLKLTNKQTTKGENKASRELEAQKIQSDKPCKKRSPVSQKAPWKSRHTQLVIRHVWGLQNTHLVLQALMDGLHKEDQRVRTTRPKTRGWVQLALIIR